MKQIYVDESINIHANFATLVAMEFDSKILKNFIKEFYEIIKLITDTFPKSKKSEKTIYPIPILHGKNFLQNSKENMGLKFDHLSDDFRFMILEQIIALINRWEIKIARFGYSNYAEIVKITKDEKLYSFNWFALLEYYNNKNSDEEYLFIMDGTNQNMIKKASTIVQNTKYFSYVFDINKKNLSLPNAEKFINNIFYVPSKFSEPIQLVDIISYLLQKKDYVKITGNKTTFNKHLIRILTHLNEKLFSENIVKMTFTKNNE